MKYAIELSLPDDVETVVYRVELTRSRGGGADSKTFRKTIEVIEEEKSNG